MTEVNTEHLDMKQLEGLDLMPPLYDYRSVHLVDGVDLDIYFPGSHASEADLGEPGEFKTILKNTDIFLPEMAGWIGDDVGNYNKISKGDFKRYERTLKELQLGYGGSHPYFQKALFASLYNTHVSVAFVDLPRGHRLLAPLDELVGYVPPSIGSFQDEIDLSRSWLVAFAKLDMKREEHILSSFSQTVEDKIQSNPKLRSRRDNADISVAMLLGSSHAGIYDAFEHTREQTTAVDPNLRFSVTPHYGFAKRKITFSEQVHARVIRGLPVDDLLIAKCVLADRLVQDDPAMIPGSSTDKFEQMYFSKIDPLSLQELSELYDRLQP